MWTSNSSSPLTDFVGAGEHEREIYMGITSAAKVFSGTRFALIVFKRFMENESEAAAHDF